MADKRISQLVERVDIANNDVVPIVASGATTTNKATISSIQTFMQENLDVGVTSVGITIGTSGTDVSVTGSPVTTSGNITINIPDASASARGVVTSESQTFGGVKTFADGLSLPSLGGGNQITKIVNIGTLHQGSGSLNQIGFNSGNNIYFGKGLSNGGVISWNNAAVRYYTLQDADGTLAFTSDIPSLAGYVTLDTAQTITAQKTFTTSGSSDTMIISHGSGSGFALDVIKAGNNEALRVTKTSGSGNAVTISGGDFEAGAAKFGGTVRPTTNMIADLGSGSIRWSTLFGRNIDLTEEAIINGVNAGRGGGSLANNTRFGTSALGANTTGTGNTSIGSSSLSLNTTGSLNTSVGTGSLQANTIGGSNTSVGVNSLLNNTEGGANTSVGSNSLSYNTTGGSNTSVGSVALYNNTTGSGNTALGWASLYNNINGSNNSALGYLSLYENTTGQTNVGIGFYSLFKNTTGSNNTALGYTSGAYIADGSTANSISNNSVYIGAYTKALGNDQTNQIVIGHSVIGNGSNTVTIGNDSITNTYLKGAVTLTGALNGTSAVFSEQVRINQAGQSLLIFPTTTSSARMQIQSSGGGNLVVGTESSAGGDLASGTSAYASVFTSGSTRDLFIGTNSVQRLKIDGSTGAATFSSSVTVSSNDGIVVGANSRAFIRQTIGGDAEIGAPSGGTLSLINNGSASLSFISTGAATFSSSVQATSGKFYSANGTTYASAAQLRVDGGGVNNNYAQIVFTDSALSDGKISYFPAAAAENRFFSISARQIESDFVIRGSGSVGIGTATPRTAATGGHATLDIKGGIYFGSTNSESTCINNDDSMIFNIDANNDASGVNFFRFATNTTGETGGTELMRITDVGNVGIGTDSPNLSGGAAGSTILTVSASTSARNAVLELNGTRTNSTDISGYVRFFNNGAATPLADIRAIRGSSDTSGDLAFETSNSERMRITSGGIVDIAGPLVVRGTLPVDQSDAAVIDHNGSTMRIFSYGAGGTTGDFQFRTAAAGAGSNLVSTINGSTGVYTAVSDINKKKDFEESSIGLNEILGLKPTLYRMINDESEGEKELGFIAQEVKDFIPYAYVESGEEEEKFIGLNYNPIVAALVKAVQELKIEIDTLKNQMQ